MRSLRTIFVVLLASGAMALAGCGGGGGGASGSAGTSGASTGSLGGSSGGSSGGTTATPAISGTAATGAAMKGATVTIKDSAGKTVQGTTSATDGTFKIAVTNLVPPLMLQAVGTDSKGVATTLYSFLPSMNMTSATPVNVNITPITNLIVYEVTNQADPGVLYRNPGAFSAITAAGIAAAQTKVRSNLPIVGVSSGFDMMYDPFVVGGGNPYDAALDTLQIVQNGANVTYSVANVPGTVYNSGTAAPGATPTPTISLALAGAVSSSSMATVTATVKNAAGNPVDNAIVTFSTNDPLGSFTTNAGLTGAVGNLTGQTTTKIKTTSSTGGAATITATSQVAGVPVTATLNYPIGAANITMSAVTFGSAPLSAYGQTSVLVTVLNGGVALPNVTVNFSSTCAGLGKATLTASRMTDQNGIAQASYLDNGCGTNDTITASSMNGVTATGTLTVNKPILGSIQYVSAVPTNIALKGTGGTGRQEASQVTFKVVDTNGKPMAATVDFVLSTSQGGMALTAASADSDPVTGNVSTTVNAGTVSTPVRVTATVRGSIPLLSTQSGQLVVSTGVPSQSNFSISVSTHNIEGWQYDGTTTSINARIADHYGNPVPDGTAVSFITAGGAITPSCTTVGGTCSATLTSQDSRPKNGRVPVLAYAVGEESFIDANNNGLADPGETVDVNGRLTFINDPYLDLNENQTRDANETFFDLDTAVTTYPAQDAVYHGVLCNKASAGFCSARDSVYVSNSPQPAQLAAGAAAPLPALPALPATPQNVITFSSSVAAISALDRTVNPAVAVNNLALASADCSAIGIRKQLSFKAVVVDVNGNAMPAGTTVTFSTTSGSITSPTTYTVPDTSGCRTGSVSSVDGSSSCPAAWGSATFGEIDVTLANTLSSQAPCTWDGNALGTFTIKVSSPKGLVTTKTIQIN